MSCKGPGEWRADEETLAGHCLAVVSSSYLRGTAIIDMRAIVQTSPNLALFERIRGGESEFFVRKCQ